MTVKTKECPIELDPVHCQNCYFIRDGKCEYEKVVKENGKPEG